MKHLKFQNNEYLMESEEETIRLDIKTNIKTIEKQATWAGIKPGMRVIDLGCGSGKTTFILNKLIHPEGTVIGIDFSKDRIEFAREHYSINGIDFKCKDIRETLDNFGTFDFVWIRFVLEYYRSDSFDILKNISKILKPGGILCLIDLDNNCLNHFGLSQRLEKNLFNIMKILEKKVNFDPYIGRKLYSFLYKLGYQNIDVDVSAHHLMFGKLKNKDAFNWKKKIEVVCKKINFNFNDYKDGYKEFLDEFNKFFYDPGRFTYTPVICCKGIKPIN